ncbi:MAG: molybdopterin-containing oxidoreductase family protein [Promethearchaeota archaeon]
MVLKKFNCPMCNAGCGLIADVQNNKIISVKPDPNYPLTKGYCCPKGIALGDVTNDNDRVKRPLKRINGEFKEISWKRALHEIADKLSTLKDIFGGDSIAYYLGTNSVHQYAHSMFAVGLMDALGSKMMYNAGSVDNNNNFVAQNILFGSSVVMPIPDLPNTDLLVLIGANPAVSNLSLVTCSNVMKVLKGIKARKGEIYIIDPRRNETAKILTKKDDGYHIPIYPDTDIYMLLAMINTVIKEKLIDQEYINQNTYGFEKLKKIVEPFTLELAEKCCKIPQKVLYDLTVKFARTKKAVMYGRLGISLSSFATLNIWAIYLLNIITGKLDRPGGSIFGKNLINIAKLGRIIGQGSFDNIRSRVGGYPDVMGAFPLGTLAKEILREKEPVRALILSGGNPLLSAPNSNEFRKALDKLEFLIVLDFYINETAAYKADYILPTRVPTENSNSPIFLLNYQVFPHVEYSHALVETDLYGSKSEWEILLSLARLMKIPMFGSTLLDSIPKLYSLLHKKYHPEFLIKLFLFLGQILEKKYPRLSSNSYTLKKLKNRKEVLLLGKNQYGVLEKYIQTKNKKINLMDLRLEEQLNICEQSINAKIRELSEIENINSNFLMIGRRNLKTMNSWMHNIQRLWRNKQEPHLFIHPTDAKKLNLIDNEHVIVENHLGAIKVPIKITDEIMPKVLCYPHGWGHKNRFLSFASQYPGENINFLTDNKKLDTLSGQPVMNGYKVSLRKLD